MGRAILQEGADQADLQIVGALVEEAPEKELPAGPPLFTVAREALAAGPGAVVLEFTTSEAALLHLRAVAESGNPIVLGTTGLGSEGEQVVEETANRVPVVVAPNTSTGVTLLTSALKALADDGLVEAVVVRDAPGFTLGVQWHPEWKVSDDPVSMAIFRAFGEACGMFAG